MFSPIARFTIVSTRPPQRETGFEMPSPRRVKVAFIGLFIIGVIALLITDNRTIRTAHGFSFGPPDGRTGAPGESTCNGCHLGTSGIGQLTITVPSSYL